MSERHAKKKIGLNVDLSASANISAELKAEVPSSSMGRLVDALTDIIRPFTESRGLRADQIRLQREDVLIEITKRAHARLEIGRATIEPISNKFLVPFLEKASLEDPRSDLIDKWVSLLAQAARGESEELIWCIGLLSELNGDDVALLDSMYESAGASGTVKFERFTRAQVQAAFDNILNPRDMRRDVLPSHLYEDLVQALRKTVDYFRIYHGSDIPNTNEVHMPLSGSELTLSRLEALGLAWVFAESAIIRHPPGSRGKTDERDFVLAAALSPKGMALVEACKGESD